MFVSPVVSLAIILGERLMPDVLHAKRGGPLLREDIAVDDFLRCSMLSQLAQILLLESRKMVLHRDLLCASSFIQLGHFQVL